MGTGRYLRLMRARFDHHNDVDDDPVPWHLDDKATAYRYVQSRGFRTPRHARVRHAAAAVKAGRRMGSRFVVKQPNRHSTKGVYILEPLGRRRFFELLSLTEKTLDDLLPVGEPPSYWLAEECLPSGVSGRPIPLDYKIYAFRGMITHVIQIDRNVYPPRVAVFDGTFTPLVAGVDYTTNPDRWLIEHHVMPRHAGTMLEMASSLSASLDTRFVRVDCFDGPEGPVFGEFTFASGPDDIHMITYSDRFLSALDDAIDGRRVPPLAGFDGARPKGASLEGPDTVLARLASGAIQGDSRYAASAIRYVPESDTRSTVLLAFHLIGYLNGDRSRAFYIQALLRNRSFPSARLEEFVRAALEFHDMRARDGNPWHVSRAAEIRLADGDISALDTLRDLAASGYGHAARVVASAKARAESLR